MLGRLNDFVNRATDVLLFAVKKQKPLSQVNEGECTVFTLVDQKTGAMIQLDQYQLEFLYLEGKRHFQD